MDLIISLFIIIYSSILHEIAHGFVAYRMGDPTAKIKGRLTLNPIPHIDPYMSILLPIMLFILSGGRFIFGGAKPVPVDYFNLKDGRRDLALVSLAGPLTNILLAILASIILHLILPFSTGGDFWIMFLYKVVQWNLVLAIFNLIPIPPLDGSKVFSLLLSPRQAETYMSMSSIGFMILFFLMFFPIGGVSLWNLVDNLVNFSMSLLGL